MTKGIFWTYSSVSEGKAQNPEDFSHKPLSERILHFGKENYTT